MRTVLFFRDYRRFTGGHLKTWHYFNHVLASQAFTPRIWFSARTTWEHNNPWRDARDSLIDHEQPIRPDVVFVGGPDWRMWDQYPLFDPNIPVINLVQHVRHGDAADKRFAFLSRFAVRICVSEEVAASVRAAEIANGPVIVIPLGLDLENFPSPSGNRQDIDVLIAGLKQPELGAQLEQRLQRPGRRVELLSAQISRPDFLDRIRHAKSTVFLPNLAEGCHMPPMEGMALGTLVVCPDVPGVSYCRAGYNAFRPEYSIDGLVEAAESALVLPSVHADEFRANARRTAEEHSLQRERQAFLDVLSSIDQLWEGANGVPAPGETWTREQRHAAGARRRARPAAGAHRQRPSPAAS